MAEKAKNSTKAKKVSPAKTTTANSRQSVSSEVIKSNKSSESGRAAKAIAIIVTVCVILFLIAFLFKGVFVAASVNGEPISRIVVVKTLEKQSGPMVLDNLITKALILQEAKRRNIVISQQDIDKEVGTISDSLKKQGTTLEKAMEGQGMTREELDDELRVQLALKKMTAGETKITEKEIEDFITTNSDSFPEGTTDEQKKTMAKTQLEQQKSAEKSQTLISDLQKKAKIIHYAGY